MTISDQEHRHLFLPVWGKTTHVIEAGEGVANIPSCPRCFIKVTSIQLRQTSKIALLLSRAFGRRYPEYQWLATYCGHLIPLGEWPELEGKGEDSV